jgi:hypothetical protein
LGVFWQVAGERVINHPLILVGKVIDSRKPGFVVEDKAAVAVSQFDECDLFDGSLA